MNPRLVFPEFFSLILHIILVQKPRCFQKPGFLSQNGLNIITLVPALSNRPLGALGPETFCRPFSPLAFTVTICRRGNLREKIDCERDRVRFVKAINIHFVFWLFPIGAPCRRFYKLGCERATSS